MGVIFILKLELYNHAFPVITGKVWDFHLHEELKKKKKKTTTEQPELVGPKEAQMSVC